MFIAPPLQVFCNVLTTLRNRFAAMLFWLKISKPQLTLGCKFRALTNVVDADLRREKIINLIADAARARRN